MARRTIVAAVALGALALAAPAVLHASCLFQTVEQQEAAADVIFAGVALEAVRPNGVQRFEVERYLKGDGPAVVGVATGAAVTSISVVAGAGDRWRIYATRSAGGTLETNLCAGSALLGATSAPPAEPGASDGWSVGGRVALLAGLLALLAAIGAVAIRGRRRRLATLGRRSAA